MHVMTQLPHFPTDELTSHAASQEPFIDEQVVSQLIAATKKPRQERRYFGEDFAGKIDLVVASASHTEEVSFVDHVEQPLAVFSATTITPWRRVLAVASAAAVLTLASLLGLWAAHSITPEQSSKASSEAKNHKIASLQHRSH